MMNFKREAALLNPVSSFAQDNTFSIQQVEMQFYNHRIDLYGFSPEKNLTVAIELKLKNWRRAYEQALLYQLCSDLVFIALPERTIHSVDKDLLAEHGLGLLSVQDKHTCNQILAPKVSNVVRKHYRDGYVSILLSEDAE